jgi:hypothetical protein
MEFVELKEAFTGKGDFSVFDEAAYIGGICVPGVPTTAGNSSTISPTL